MVRASRLPRQPGRLHHNAAELIVDRHLRNKVYSWVDSDWTFPQEVRHVRHHRRSLDRPGSGDRRATLGRMIEVLRHRGPDDAGVYASEYQARTGYDAVPGVALGHRRLSIIDVRRPPAAVQRGRHGLGRLQRRNLQLPRAAAPAGRLRPPVPHPQRHRGDRPPLRGRRARLAAAPQRHVRPGHLGRPAAISCSWPAIGWARSRWSIATSRAGCCSPAS